MLAASLHEHGDLFRADALAAAGVEIAMSGDPSADAGGVVLVGDGDEEGPTGMLAGDFADDRRVVGEVIWLFAVDGEVDERGTGDGEIAGEEIFQFALHGGEWDFGAKFGKIVGKRWHGGEGKLGAKEAMGMCGILLEGFPKESAADWEN